ncbi:MAG: hypothetical protein ACLFUS_09715 [Candidatus Sumerlaeia bacterium]
MSKRIVFTLTILIMLACPCFAQEWVDLGDKMLASNAGRGARAIAVDPESGTIFKTNKSDLFLSKDQGQTWEAIDQGQIKGALWFALSLRYDPLTGGIAVFKKDPQDQEVQGAISMDLGQTWHPFTRVTEGMDKLRSYGWSWGVVDWSDNPPQNMLARMHHSTRIWKTTDGGQNWAELSPQSSYFGIFDDKTYVVALDKKKSIIRTTDAGATWETVQEDIEITAHIPTLRGDHMYWLAKDGVIYTDDQGKSWQKTEGRLEDAYWGPYFGLTENDMMVITLEAIYLTHDGGKTWNRVADNRAREVEKDFGEPKHRFDWFIGRTGWGWDATNNIIYVGHGKLEKLQLPKAGKGE